MDDLTRVNTVVEGDYSRKSYCIVTGDQLMYGLSRQQLENLQRRIEVFREKEKVARKRMKETRGDFWFSIEMDMNLDETCDELQTRYCVLFLCRENSMYHLLPNKGSLRYPSSVFKG